MFFFDILNTRKKILRSLIDLSLTPNREDSLKIVVEVMVNNFGRYRPGQVDFKMLFFSSVTNQTCVIGVLK